MGIAACAVFLVMVCRGKALRQRSKKDYWALLKKHTTMGMVH